MYEAFCYRLRTRAYLSPRLDLALVRFSFVANDLLQSPESIYKTEGFQFQLKVRQDDSE